MTDQNMIKKLDEIEKDISELKLLVTKELHTSAKKKPVFLQGLLKGITVTEKDITDAKKSIFHS